MVDDYGILYTTGPDTVTTIVEPLMSQVTMIPPHKYVTHLETGTWRRKRDI